MNPAVRKGEITRWNHRLQPGIALGNGLPRVGKIGAWLTLHDAWD
jgi:hypothetical protein